MIGAEQRLLEIDAFPLGDSQEALLGIEQRDLVGGLVGLAGDGVQVGQLGQVLRRGQPVDDPAVGSWPPRSDLGRSRPGPGRLGGQPGAIEARSPAVGSGRLLHPPGVPLSAPSGLG